jgi:hypothetical protein
MTSPWSWARAHGNPTGGRDASGACLLHTPDPELVKPMRLLRLDAAAIEAIKHLGSIGIDVVLLKGASFADWLYDQPGERNYGDVDLLVAPADFDRVGEALKVLGYSVWLSQPVSDRAKVFVRNGLPIDLHRRLEGVLLNPDAAWRALRANTQVFRLHGHPMRILNEPARTLHLALHAARRGRRDPQALIELERGVRRLDHGTWVNA